MGYVWIDYKPFLDNDQSFNLEYHRLLNDLQCAPENINARTGHTIKALSGRHIELDLSHKIPLVNTRKMFPVTAFAELCWTLSGVKRLDWLQQHTKMWDKFANKNNEVEAAYGYRWREMFGRDQLFQGIEALKRDISDRQIFISAWDNSKDGLGNRWTSNVPCPLGFCINVINCKVNLVLFLRSSDVIVGLPYDLLMYSLLLVAITNELRQTYPGLTYGTLSASLAHAHIYDSHFDIADEMIKIASEYDRDKFIVQDLHYDKAPILWKLLTVTDIIHEPDTAMQIFKDCIFAEYGENQLFPKYYKPEVIQ